MKLTKAQFDALRVFADANGRTWKSKLVTDWMTGRAEGELQQVRNNLGPGWLKVFQFRNYDGVQWGKE